MTPTTAQHLSQVAHNETFVRLLDEKTYSDWVLTGIFYAALHLVEAYLAQSSQHSRDHEARNSKVARDPWLTRIELDYMDLYNRSRLARYQCYPLAPADIEQSRQEYERICRHVQQALQSPRRNP